MGMTTLGVDTVLSHPNPNVRTSPWAMVLVAFVSGGGGGLLVPMFKMFGPEWGFTATPAFVKDGLPIDVWSAALIGYVYAYESFLLSPHAFLFCASVPTPDSPWSTGRSSTPTRSSARSRRTCSSTCPGSPSLSTSRKRTSTTRTTRPRCSDPPRRKCIQFLSLSPSPPPSRSLERTFHPSLFEKPHKLTPGLFFPFPRFFSHRISLAARAHSSSRPCCSCRASSCRCSTRRAPRSRDARPSERKLPRLRSPPSTKKRRRSRSSTRRDGVEEYMTRRIQIRGQRVVSDPRRGLGLFVVVRPCRGGLKKKRAGNHEISVHTIRLTVTINRGGSRCPVVSTFSVVTVSNAHRRDREQHCTTTGHNKRARRGEEGRKNGFGGFNSRTSTGGNSGATPSRPARRRPPSAGPTPPPPPSRTPLPPVVVARSRNGALRGRVRASRPLSL